MSYHKHYKRIAVLHCVSAYVSRDHSVEQMPYDTQHKGMTVSQCVSAHVSGDDPFEQVPYYKHYWKLHNFRYMYQAVRSQ
jgi:hypothetical protein